MTDQLGVDGVLAGRYDLIEVIGRGRSVVYRARDRRLGRDVAVKQVELAGGPATGGPADVRARAMREARAVARITSPFVVGVFDVVEERDAVWLVMELVRAPSLDQLVDAEGPLDERAAAHIGLGVLAALESAHAEGIVHRDVKPGNVLVGGPDHEDDGAGADPLPVKLADFGVAALRDETSVTSPGAVIGSPSYMAPEQASGRPVGPAADLWAVGALLYFMVEGEPPFLAASAIATATAVVHAEPRPQERPGRLSSIIWLLLDKQAERRPGGDQVRGVLQSVAAGLDTGEVVGGATGPVDAIGPVGDGVSRQKLPNAAEARAGELDGDLRDGDAASDPSPLASRIRPARRRIAWAAAVLVVVMGVAALGFGGDDDGTAVEADPVVPEDSESDGPLSTTPAFTPPAPGDAPAPRPDAGDQPPRQADDATPEVTTSSVPETPDTTAPPETTTSLPPSTTTTVDPDPDPTTPSTTEPDTPPTTPTTAPEPGGGTV